MNHCSVTLVGPLTLALPDCFLLPYLGHISPISEIKGLLQLIIICVFFTFTFT